MPVYNIFPPFSGPKDTLSSQRHLSPDIASYVIRIQTALEVTHHFQKVADKPSEALYPVYSLNVEQNDAAPIAPWSASKETYLHAIVPDLPSRATAISHFDVLISDIFSDTPNIVNKDLVWHPVPAVDGVAGKECMFWEKAPSPLWNGFMERRFIPCGEDSTWSYHVTISLHKTLCILCGLHDLRLAEASRFMTLSTVSYTFGLSLPHVDFDKPDFNAVVARQLRRADLLVNGTLGRCESLSIVRDDVNFGVSCAITLSRISEHQHPYTLDEGRQDIEKLVAAMRERLELESTVIRFTQPVINLTSLSDLSKELILKLAGGNGLLAITMKDFMDRETVSKTLRGLETEADFWTSYEHELYDKDTGTKRYEFYGVYRPKIAYPFNRTYLEPPESEEWNTYFSSSRALGEQLRRRLRPFEYPVDRFLAHLDTIIDTNVHIHPKFGKKMQAGMLRLMPSDSITGIHVDRLPDRDLGHFRNILSTNFYTAPSTTEKGGELLIWDAPSIRYGSDLIGKVKTDFISVHISPEDGDAIMICPELPHAIARVTQGKRLSLNVFLGLAAEEDRISVWN